MTEAQAMREAAAKIAEEWADNSVPKRIRALPLPALQPNPVIEAMAEVLERFAKIICLVDAKDPSKGFAFDRYSDDRAVFSVGSERTITAGDLRKAKAALATYRASTEQGGRT